MRHFLKRAALAVVAGMAGVAPGADEIKLYAWSRGDARPSTASAMYDSGEDIDITVDGSVTIIQIIADDPTSQSIGHVLIRSDRSASNALRLLIAGEAIADFPGQPTSDMPEGCLHWAGVHALDVGSTSGTPGQDTATGNSLLVAAAIHGNFAQGSSSEGRIEAGHVYRLESEGTVSGGGNLTIPVWAYGEGFIQDGNPFHTIGVVHVSNSITATVRADNTSSIFSYQFHDISRIRVGPSTSAAGISGRILCPKGSISQITSTGPISITTTGTDAGILAGTRIELIYAGEEGVSVPTVARDISARVVCKKLDSQGQPTVGTLRKLRTAGDLHLPVDVVDIAPPSDFVTCGEDYGIWVKGEVKKPINVAHHVRVAIIRGGTFADDADVTIGWYLKGTVEATDSDGILRHVSVGRGAGTPSVTRGINGWEGACGIDQYVDPDSIIRAKTIEWADVLRMYLHYDKNRAPRIEADTINLLTIDEMITGEVRGHSTGSDAYAVIGAAEFGDIFGGVPSISGAGPALVRCESFTTFDVLGGNGGDLHFKTIPADRAVRIGIGMNNEGSVYSSPYRAGRVQADTTDSLLGQVIINTAGAASPAVGDYCDGPVIVEHGTTDFSISAAASTNNLDTLIEYTRPSPQVGGGAVGLAPFYLFDEDSVPVNYAAASASLLQSQFGNYPGGPATVGIRIRFYGPVRTAHASDSPVQLWLAKIFNGTTYLSRIPDGKFIVTMKRGTDSGFSREIEIHGNGSYEFGAGEYYVVPKSGALYSDLVDGNPEIAGLWNYHFNLRLDCDNDGVEDAPQDCPRDCEVCPADFNDDGGVDGGDVEAFFTVWETGNSYADVDCNGGVDGGDVQEFFIRWEAGGCE